MKPIRALRAALAALACAAAFPAAAETLRVVERATTDAVSVHAGTAKDNVGDVLTFANPIFDAANTTQLGTDQGYCVRLVPGRTFECHWTMKLAQGQVMTDGPFDDAGDTTMAIVGGTGAYTGARGEMKLHARDAAGSAYDFTYEMK